MFRKKKIRFGRIIPPFFSERSESDGVFNYLHDSNSIFRVGRIISEWVSARTVLGGLRNSAFKMMQSLWKIIPTWPHGKKEVGTENPATFL